MLKKILFILINIVIIFLSTILTLSIFVAYRMCRMEESDEGITSTRSEQGNVKVSVKTVPETRVETISTNSIISSGESTSTSIDSGRRDTRSESRKRKRRK